MSQYKINQSIYVRYLELEKEAGVIDLVLTPANPSGADQSPISFSDLGNGLYQAYFTPNTIGWWQVRVSSVSKPGNVYARSYFVGTEYTTYPTQEDGNILDIENKIGEVQTTPTANTLLRRLKDIWDKLVELFNPTNGTARIKLWDGTNQAGIDSNNSLFVGGKSAIGVAPNSNPIYISGIDNTGLKRGILTDAQGRIFTSGINPIAKSLTLNYDVVSAIGGATSGSWIKALYYVVPANYYFFAIQFICESADNRMSARMSKFIIFGNYNIGTQTFTDGNSYTLPIFANSLEAEVTTVIGGTNNLIITVTYVNQDNIIGRTGTITIPKNTLVGTKIQMIFQLGDFGVIDITSVTQNLVNTGIVQLDGTIELFYTAMPSASFSYNIPVSKESIIIEERDTIALDFRVNAASNVERIIKLIGLISPK